MNQCFWRPNFTYISDICFNLKSKQSVLQPLAPTLPKLVIQQYSTHFLLDSCYPINCNMCKFTSVNNRGKSLIVNNLSKLGPVRNSLGISKRIGSNTNRWSPAKTTFVWELQLKPIWWDFLSDIIGKFRQANQKQSHIPRASMGLVYIYLHGIQSDTWNRPPWEALVATKRSRLEAPESTSQVTSQAGCRVVTVKWPPCCVYRYTPKN